MVYKTLPPPSACALSQVYIQILVHHLAVYKNLDLIPFEQNGIQIASYEMWSPIYKTWNHHEHSDLHVAAIII